MVNHSPFKEYVKEIVYSLSKSSYDELKDRKYLMISHDKYKDKERHVLLPLKKFQEEWNYQDYAYGYLINPFYTQIAPLDYDNITLDYMACKVDFFLKNPQITAVDIVQSSNHSYHVYLGLDKPMNITKLYLERNITSCCWGFCHFASIKKEVIMRASAKFHIRNGQHCWDIQTNLLPKVAYRRESGETWRVYNANQILPPLLKTRSPEEEQSRRKKLRIR